MKERILTVSRAEYSMMCREAKQNEWRNRKTAARQEEMHHKLTVAQAAEAEKMAQFQALVAQGPISIARRPAAE